MSFLPHCTFRSSKVTSQNGNAALWKLFLQEFKLGVTPFLSHYVSPRVTKLRLLPRCNNLSRIFPSTRKRRMTHIPF
jgi:hypothetical protein